VGKCGHDVFIVPSPTVLAVASAPAGLLVGFSAQVGSRWRKMTKVWASTLDQGAQSFWKKWAKAKCAKRGSNAETAWPDSTLFPASPTSVAGAFCAILIVDLLALLLLAGDGPTV